MAFIKNGIFHNMHFETEESQQKVWNRLCEITGAKDIFDCDNEKQTIKQDYIIQSPQECEGKVICWGCKNIFNHGELNNIGDMYYCDKCYVQKRTAWRTKSDKPE